MPAFSTFQPYINHYLEASQTLKQLYNSDKKLKKLLNQLNNEYEPLDSIIVMPVQRLVKYALLLKEVQKHTATWHPDYEQFTEAIKKMDDLAQAADEKMLEADRRNKLFDLQASIQDCPNLIDPARILLKLTL